MSVDADLGIQKLLLLLEKRTNFLETEKFCWKHHSCLTKRIETIFGVLWVSNSLR